MSYPTVVPFSLQMLLVYVQLESLLGLLDIQWPSVMGGLFKAASTQPRHTNLSCAHPVSAVHPICCPSSPLQRLDHLVWQSRLTTTASFDWSLLARQLELTAYSVLGYYYPALVQASLSIFSCLTIDHPVPTNMPYGSSAQVCMLHA